MASKDEKEDAKAAKKPVWQPKAGGKGHKGKSKGAANKNRHRQAAAAAAALAQTQATKVEKVRYLV